MEELVVLMARKIDVFAHILPRTYLDRLEPQLERTLSGPKLSYYREGVFRFDPALTDLDTRWRRLDLIDDYVQVLVLAVPPLEEVGDPNVAAALEAVGDVQGLLYALGSSKYLREMFDPLRKEWRQ